MVIVMVLALIVTSVVLLTPPDEGPRIKGNRFKLQDILGHDFQPLRFNGTWVTCKHPQRQIKPIQNPFIFFFSAADELIYKDEFGGISLMNVTTLKVRSLMSNQTYVS